MTRADIDVYKVHCVRIFILGLRKYSFANKGALKVIFRFKSAIFVFLLTAATV